MAIMNQEKKEPSKRYRKVNIVVNLHSFSRGFTLLFMFCWHDDYIPSKVNKERAGWESTSQATTVERKTIESKRSSIWVV
jgi:hypothetical protein